MLGTFQLLWNLVERGRKAPASRVDISRYLLMRTDNLGWKGSVLDLPCGRLYRSDSPQPSKACVHCSLPLSRGLCCVVQLAARSTAESTVISIYYSD